MRIYFNVISGFECSFPDSNVHFQIQMFNSRFKCSFPDSNFNWLYICAYTLTLFPDSNVHFPNQILTDFPDMRIYFNVTFPIRYVHFPIQMFISRFKCSFPDSNFNWLYICAYTLTLFPDSNVHFPIQILTDFI